MQKVQVRYLHHSCFLIEINNSVFIFDYYKDECCGKRSLENGVFVPEDFKDKENIFVFASHKHHDHFNPVIFSWSKMLPQIQY
ncbi:MAG: MBL fold metallo-hydrolase, partial [Clostridiaceae bacterium]|nr:MBL fold metallo-hydrolase [Clostridiaceae bacterium]